jgi:hypothetical protein
MKFKMTESCCWICLESQGREEEEKLVLPCNCPRHVHPTCLARWQIQSSGKEDEHKCRFCGQTLPFWRDVLERHLGIRIDHNHAMGHRMSFCYQGKTVRLRVPSDGEFTQERFLEAIRNVFGLPFSEGMACSFVCRNPLKPNEKITLKGLESFSAAMQLTAINTTLRYKKNENRFFKWLRGAKIK